tara:strand:+ start:576 stop:791 length:216 start_codon:yes stop_codon:yes gene_type:complete
MTIEPAALRENFTAQFNAAVEEIKTLEAQIVTKKELALKLKGALEALDLMDPPEERQEPVEEPEVAAETEE